MVLLLVSKRVTVQSKIGRSATTNPLDERIDHDQSTGSTLRPGRPQEHPQPFRSESHPGLSLTVLEVGALSDLDNITVRIADVAANLAILGYCSVMNWLLDFSTIHSTLGYPQRGFS